MNNLLWREGAFIRMGRLKEGNVHELFLMLGGAFIGGRRLKEGGRLLEDLPYSSKKDQHFISISALLR